MQGTDGIWAKADAMRSRDIVKNFIGSGVPPGFNNFTLIPPKSPGDPVRSRASPESPAGLRQ